MCGDTMLVVLQQCCSSMTAGLVHAVCMCCISVISWEPDSNTPSCFGVDSQAIMFLARDLRLHKTTPSHSMIVRQDSTKSGHSM